MLVRCIVIDRYRDLVLCLNAHLAEVWRFARPFPFLFSKNSLSFTVEFNQSTISFGFLVHLLYLVSLGRCLSTHSIVRPIPRLNSFDNIIFSYFNSGCLIVHVRSLILFFFFLSYFRFFPFKKSLQSYIVLHAIPFSKIISFPLCLIGSLFLHNETLDLLCLSFHFHFYFNARLCPVPVQGIERWVKETGDGSGVAFTRWRVDRTTATACATSASSSTWPMLCRRHYLSNSTLPSLISMHTVSLCQPFFTSHQIRVLNGLHMHAGLSIFLLWLFFIGARDYLYIFIPCKDNSNSQ